MPADGSVPAWSADAGSLRPFFSGRPRDRSVLCTAAFAVAASLAASSAHAFPSEEVEVQVGTRLPLAAGLPFLLVLLSIAVLPQAAPRFWSRHRGKIATAWALTAALPFGFRFGAVAVQEIAGVLLSDYVPFILLLWALYSITGGIVLSGGFDGTTRSNVALLASGTLLASVMGTTGAAMLLVRPLLRANAWRRRRVHVVVFFIFLACNVGGSLTPLGDPPLFLGFLRGVPFAWPLRLLPVTGGVTVALLGAFAVLDAFLARTERDSPPPVGRLRLEGAVNLLLLGGVLGAVAGSGVIALGKVGYGGVTRDVAGLLRDLALLVLGLASVVVTRPEARVRNQFSWEPIREVASLFPGIFVAMLPVVLMLKAGEHGPLAWVHEALGGPGSYFCLTGALSSVLDNTPTYLVFLSAALGTFSPHAPEPDALAALLRDHSSYLQAISAGAVFMGANTYLGNAPNLLVRSVAQEAGVAMPGFFGYTLRYALPLLTPVFACVFWWFS